MTIYLTTEEVIAAHYMMMKRMDDLAQAGIKDRGLLESAVHRPQQTIFGVDAYPTLMDKAAALLESVVKNHCFHNGNKRTAYVVTRSFLLLNGYNWRMKRHDAVQFIVDIATGLHEIDSIARIL